MSKPRQLTSAEILEMDSEQLASAYERGELREWLAAARVDYSAETRAAGAVVAKLRNEGRLSLSRDELTGWSIPAREAVNRAARAATEAEAAELIIKAARLQATPPPPKEPEPPPGPSSADVLAAMLTPPYGRSR